MKTAIKVFLYLGIIVGAIGAGVAFISSFLALPVSLGYLVSVVGCLIPVIVDSIALKKLKVANSKSELTGISVIVLIFGGIIAGILMLVASEDDLLSFNESRVATPKVDEAKEEKKTEDLEEELNKLKDLKEAGTITEEEYDTLRAKAVEKFTKD